MPNTKEYKNKTALNFMNVDKVRETLKEDFGVQDDNLSKKELVNKYLELVDSLSTVELKEEDGKKSWKDKIFDEFGITSFPSSILNDEELMRKAYHTLVGNDGDDKFLIDQIQSEKNAIEESLLPKTVKVKKQKKVTQYTRAEMRKYLMKVIKVKVTKNNMDIIKSPTDMENRAECLPVYWGNSRISETTQVPLGIPTMIHFGAFLGLRQAYRVNVKVDSNSGTILEDSSDVNPEYNIEILPMPTPEEIKKEQTKQALAEEAGTTLSR